MERRSRVKNMATSEEPSPVIHKLMRKDTVCSQFEGKYDHLQLWFTNAENSASDGGKTPSHRDLIKEALSLIDYKQGKAKEYSQVPDLKEITKWEEFKQFWREFSRCEKRDNEMAIILEMFELDIMDEEDDSVYVNKFTNLGQRLEWALFGTSWADYDNGKALSMRSVGKLLARASVIYGARPEAR